MAPTLAENREAGQNCAMPLHWTISHPQRMVLAVAKDEVAPHEFGRYIAAVEDGNAGSYAKMFDITGLTGELGDGLLQSLAHAAQQRALKGPLGPMAIVATTDKTFYQATLDAEAAKVDRPLKIFRELHEARRWLEISAERIVDPA